MENINKEVIAYCINKIEELSDILTKRREETKPIFYWIDTSEIEETLTAYQNILKNIDYRTEKVSWYQARLTNPSADLFQKPSDVFTVLASSYIEAYKKIFNEVHYNYINSQMYTNDNIRNEKHKALKMFNIEEQSSETEEFVEESSVVQSLDEDDEPDMRYEGMKQTIEEYKKVLIHRIVKLNENIVNVT